MRGVRLDRVRALVALASCAAACASFGTGADEAPAPDGGAPADAGTDAPDTTPRDAGTDAGGSTCTLVPVLDARFDDQSTAGLMTHLGVGEAGAGGLTFASLDADGGNVSLYGQLQIDGAPTYLYRVVTPDAPDWCARLTFDLYYPSTPVGGFIAGPELHGVGPGTLAFEIDPSLDLRIGPDTPVTLVAKAVSYQTWHHVVLLVQRLEGKTSYDVSVDDEANPHVAVDQDLGASFELRLGVTSAAPGAHGELNLDDVSLEVGTFKP